MANIDINVKSADGGIDNNASKKWMSYLADGGQSYAVKIDENIGESLGFTDILDDDLIFVEKPQSLSMRRVNAVSANGKVKISYPVGKNSEPIYREGGTIKVPRKGFTEGLTLVVTGVVGEKRRLPNGKDTGQDSGDAT